jgi:hypothetical protein
MGTIKEGPIKQNGPRGARPAGVGQKKDKFPFGIWHWDREIRGVRSDHNRDREPVARKIIAKGGYHNENRLCSTRTPEVNTGGEHLSEHTDRQTNRKLFPRDSHNTI